MSTREKWADLHADATVAAGFRTFSIDTAVSETAVPIHQLFTAADLHDASARLMLYSSMMQCAAAAGGSIILSPDLNYIPALRNKAGEPVALHEFVEGVDGLVEYGELCEMFDLTYAQIHSAFTFLRKLSSTNPSGWDPDGEEMKIESVDQEFIAALRRGLDDKESFRVLDAG
jgi:hypothetical protein